MRLSQLGPDGLCDEIGRLFDAVDVIVLAARGDGRIEYRNAAADRFQVEGTLLDAFAVAERAAVEGALSEARAQGRWSGESLLLAKDGRSVPASIFLSSERAEAPDGRFWLLATDLSDQKRIAGELRVSNERYELVGQATHDPLWDWDLDSGIAVINDHYRQQFGPVEGRLQSYEDWVEGIHPADRVRVTTTIQSVLSEGGEGWTEEYRYRRVDGRYAHVLDRGKVMRNAAGKPVRMVGSMVDLTEREQLQDRLQLAERLTSIGILAAGVAHEINNPLAYAVLCLEQAAERLSRAAPARVTGLQTAIVELQEALGGLTRVRRIVKDLTTFAAPSAPVRAPTDVAPVIEAALNIAGNELRQKARVRLEVAEVPPVLGFPAQLGQVVLNLLVNAAQSIPEGACEQNEVAVTVRPHGAASVEIAVSDTGTGLTAEARQHMFEPFFTTKPSGHRLGLGLAISHRLVSEMGGQLAAESEDGTGTTFRMVLPAAGAAVEVARAEPEPPAVPSQQMQVLVIDDEMLICKAVRALLEPEHVVTVSTSARQALDRLGEQSFDLILCDLLMPGMTGMELYEELGRRSPEQLGAVVFMTGATGMPRAAEFLRRTGARYLEKPFTASELRSLLARAG